MRSSKKLMSILLIASILVSTSVQVSAINTPQLSEESTAVSTELSTETATAEPKLFSSNLLTDTTPTNENKTTDNDKNSTTESGHTVDTSAVKSVLSSAKSIVLENGTSQKIDIVTDPADIDKELLVWTSTNNAVAEVDNDGNITAKGVGSCSIKVSSAENSDIYAYCAVTVTQKVQNFAFQDTPESLKVGEKITISSDIVPLSSTNKILRWTSSDKNIATVSQKGLITATGNGKCTITAKTVDGSEIIKSFELTCTGEAVAPKEEIKITAVSLPTIRKIVKEGASFPMEATVTPSDASNKSLNYVSSNEKVATVDKDGNVHALAKGTCVIYVSTNDGSNLRKGCILSVEGKATSVQFTQKSVVCCTGNTVNLYPKAVPGGTYIADVIYKSSNPDVAIVDSNGVVSALKKGSCQIMCISSDGMTVYDKCDVIVHQGVTSLKIYGDSSITKGTSTTLVAKMLPYDADNKDVAWSSSDNRIAAITRDGVVYGMELGTVTITCKTGDGSGIIAEKQITVEKEPDVVERLVDIAIAQKGNGPSKYRQWFYDDEGEGIPWCAVFVSWCFRQINGLYKYIIPSDGAGSIARESVAAGLSGTWYESEYSDIDTTPQIGDVIEFVWNREGRYSSQDIYFSDHVGIVYKVDEDTVYTVEGNAGNDNDTSTVTLRTYNRKDGAINGYYRPDYTK